jgi:excisionase family DNA binding protein
MDPMNPAAARSTDPGYGLDRLLTPEQAAERLGTSLRFVRRLVFERRIAYRKLGRYVRFHPDDVEEYISANRVEANSAQASPPVVVVRRRR